MSDHRDAFVAEAERLGAVASNGITARWVDLKLSRPRSHRGMRNIWSHDVESFDDDEHARHEARRAVESLRLKDTDEDP